MYDAISIFQVGRFVPPQALDDDALQAAIEEESSLTCGELSSQFIMSDETVRLHFHRLHKTYMLSK